MTVFLKLLGVLFIIPTLLCQECDQRVDVKPPTYEFYSPQFRGGYGNGWECSWKVSVNESFRINLWFTAFEFEYDESCKDYLEMWDGSNKRASLLFRSCAESLQSFKAVHGPNAAFNSSGNTLFLMMTTDNRSSRPRKKGFSATFRSIPEPATTTETVVTTSPQEESTLPQRTTVDTENATQVEVSATTSSSLFSLSTTVKSMPISPTITLRSVPTDLSITIPVNLSTTSHSSSSDIPSLRPSPPSSPSFRIFIVVVPTVFFVLLLICIGVTGFFIHKRSSKGKSKTSPNNLSIQSVGTSPIRTIKEQSEPYSTTLYYNESFHASPQGMNPPPYQSKVDVDDIRSSQMNTCILASEGVIGNVAYESFDGEEKCNGDYTTNAGEVTNIAYESYDEENIVDNGDYVSNVDEVGNITYESYDGKKNVDNGDYSTNIGEVSNIAYESYDGQGKVENDDKVLHEGETSNVMYESYDRQENSGNSDDTANEEVSNVAYESYDGENNVTYDTDEDSMRYEAIDDSQSVDDDYSKIR